MITSKREDVGQSRILYAIKKFLNNKGKYQQTETDKV